MPESFHGKEGVDGSSPSEGSAKAPQTEAFCFGRTCRIASVRWVWSPLWSLQVDKCLSRDRSGRFCGLVGTGADGLRTAGLSRRGSRVSPLVRGGEAKPRRRRSLSRKLQTWLRERSLAAVDCGRGRTRAPARAEERAPTSDGCRLVRRRRQGSDTSRSRRLGERTRGCSHYSAHSPATRASRHSEDLSPILGRGDPCRHAVGLSARDARSPGTRPGARPAALALVEDGKRDPVACDVRPSSDLRRSAATPTDRTTARRSRRRSSGIRSRSPCRRPRPRPAGRGTRSRL